MNIYSAQNEHYVYTVKPEVRHHRDTLRPSVAGYWVICIPNEPCGEQTVKWWLSDETDARNLADELAERVVCDVPRS